MIGNIDKGSLASHRTSVRVNVHQEIMVSRTSGDINNKKMTRGDLLGKV